MNEYVNLI